MELRYFFLGGSMPETFYMKKALELAARAAGRTSPNPLVGAVIVKDGDIVGEGYHHRAGEPHAEVLALADAGDLARGADVYVTLEPCCHYGRTPPCTMALMEAGVRSVTAAMTDPNPQVSGKGLAALREAGIATSCGLLAETAGQLNEAFIKAVTRRLPFVLYKCALTLDGKTSSSSGDSRWVTGEPARAYAHRLRDIYDVIMVGSGTVISDNPALTCRLPGGRDPLRLIVDGSLSLRESAAVLQPGNGRAGYPTCVLATTGKAPPERLEALRRLPGVEVWQYEGEHVPLTGLLQDLAQKGLNSVLLEGGGILASHMLTAGLIDKVNFIYAPKLLGGTGATPLSALPAETMADSFLLTPPPRVEFLGEDILVEAYVKM
jgi:diaminohydroxyphosphoribosylaminopyrimidine deaminase/5-amino-6-(5-phosphoribosylamino)uracil reductase